MCYMEFQGLIYTYHKFGGSGVCCGPVWADRWHSFPVSSTSSYAIRICLKLHLRSTCAARTDWWERERETVTGSSPSSRQSRHFPNVTAKEVLWKIVCFKFHATRMHWDFKNACTPANFSVKRAGIEKSGRKKKRFFFFCMSWKLSTFPPT